MTETTSKPTPKRGFKFWKKSKRAKQKELSSTPNESESIPGEKPFDLGTNQPLSSTQGCSDESTSLRTPERKNIMLDQNNFNDNMNSKAIHNAKTPPFKNVAYSEHYNSVIVPPPLLSQDKSTTVITDMKKRKCLDRLHSIAESHGVYSDSKKSQTVSQNFRLDRNKHNEETAMDSSSFVNDKIKVNRIPEPNLEKSTKENSSPKSVMSDISNQIANIWKESDFSKFSSVLYCNNQSELIHEEVKRDLCFCPEFDYDQDSFDGDRGIYERYMSMKRRSRMVEEDGSDNYSHSCSDSYSDGHGTYSGRILTVTSRKDNYMEKESQKENPIINTKDVFDAHSSIDRFNGPETIDERLDKLVGNVLGECDDDSLDKMMKQLEIDKSKGFRNKKFLQKEDINTTNPMIQKRIKNGNLPWDESSQEENDMPDDERGFQFPTSRRSKVLDNATYIQSCEKAQVSKYDPLKIVRTASEESV